jgi:hypothetical protein
MLEIYVGSIYDLLIAPEEYSIKTRPALDMQMDSVAGLSQLPVATEDDVTDLLVRGFGNQTKAPTGLNVDSSRGHTIFTLEVNKIIKNPKAKKKSEKEQVHNMLHYMSFIPTNNISLRLYASLLQAQNPICTLWCLGGPHCHETGRPRRLGAYRKGPGDHEGAARGLAYAEVRQTHQSDGQDDGVLQGGAHDRGKIY